MSRSRAIRPTGVLLTVMLGTLTVSLNNSALNPAIPVFMAAFDIGPGRAGWLMTGFLLSMGLALPLTGYLGRVLGKRRLYLIGLSGFALGSVIGAGADRMAWVIAARGLQGFAGGLMIPLSLALLFEAYPEARRGRVTALWGGAVMLAPALGPAVGALVLAHSAWPALFLMNLPVAGLAAVLGALTLVSPPEARRPPFDGRGWGLAVVGIGGLLLALSQLTPAGAPAWVWALALLAAGALVALVRRERRCPHPLLALPLLARPVYRRSVVLVVIQSVGVFANLLVLPLLMQTVLGFGVADTAGVLVVTALSAALFTQVGGRWLDARGPRGVVSLGMLFTALATLALAAIGPGASLPALMAIGLVRGLGVGLAYMPATTVGLNAVPDADVAAGSALNNLLRRVAAATGVVLITLYCDGRGAALIDRGLAPVEGQMVALRELLVAVGLLVLAGWPLARRLPGAPTVSLAATAASR